MTFVPILSSRWRFPSSASSASMMRNFGLSFRNTLNVGILLGYQKPSEAEFQAPSSKIGVHLVQEAVQGLKDRCHFLACLTRFNLFLMGNVKVGERCVLFDERIKEGEGHERHFVQAFLHA